MGGREGGSLGLGVGMGLGVIDPLFLQRSLSNAKQNNGIGTSFPSLKSEPESESEAGAEAGHK